MLDKLKSILEKNKDEYINYLMELVSIDTQHIGQGIEGGKEKKGQEYLANLGKKIGADTIEFDPMMEKFIEKSKVEFNEGNLGHNYQERENLYIRFGVNTNNPTLMFNGHMDTVTPGPLELWNTDPYAAEIRDGKVYGLGTTDMKSGLLASLLAVKLLKDSKIEINNNIIISSVVDEEGGGNGSIQAALNGPKADSVIVTEGTNYELILAHMGFVFFRISVEGKANHAGEKMKGVNAFDKLYKIIQSLKELEYEWLFEYKHALLPPPNINFGVINSGSSGATVPGKAMMELCIHYHPDTMDFTFVKEAVFENVHRVTNSDSWLRNHAPEIEIFQAGGAFQMNENSEIVDAFKYTYAEQFGEEVKIVGSPAGCDSRIWLNIAGIPTIQYGPGRLEECHSPNEFIKIEEYIDSILTYAMLIVNYRKED